MYGRIPHPWQLGLLVAIVIIFTFKPTFLLPGCNKLLNLIVEAMLYIL